MKKNASKDLTDMKLDLIIYDPTINRRNGDAAYAALYAGRMFDVGNTDAVKMLQRVVTFFDFLPSPQSINGRYDGSTMSAVRFFQSRNNLPVDGQMSAATSEMMYNQLKRTVSTQSVDQTKQFAKETNPSRNTQANLAANELYKDPRVRAMLDVIAYAEGTNDNYHKLVNGIVVKSPNPGDIGKNSKNVMISLAQHPRIYVRWKQGEKLSSAAGRYQFLYDTWKGLGLPNFSEPSQDIGAIKLMQQRKMIAPLLNNNFEQAVQNGSPEWASFPDANKGGASHYGGQPARNIKQLKNKYQESLAKYQKG